MKDVDTQFSLYRKVFWFIMIIGTGITVFLFGWSLKLNWSSVKFSDIDLPTIPVEELESNLSGGENSQSSDSLQKLESTLNGL